MTEPEGRRRLPAVFAAVVAALSTGSCTGPAEAPPVRAAPTSLTYAEAAAKVPMNGTEKLPITWDTSKVPDTDVVLAARRTLAYFYYQNSTPDWVSVAPIARPLYTAKNYAEVMEPFAGSTDSGADDNGILWIKTMGVEQVRPNHVRVDFCTDIGYLRYDADSPRFREDRAYLQAQDMFYVKTTDGSHRWLLRSHIDNAADRKPLYGAECAKWAQHKP